MKNDVRPFQIAGNVYYVGDSKDASHVIDTGDGLILIDTPRDPDSAALVRSNMESLELRVEDLKLILVSHGHFDHWQGVPELVRLSGARTFLGEPDLILKPGFTPDELLHDGDRIQLGNTDILCIHTPGHTVGTMSFFFDVQEGDNIYRAAMFGGAGIAQVAKAYLDKHGLSYEQQDMFYRSIERVREERVDIFLGNHPGQNRILQKAERAATEGHAAFVDPSEWRRFLDNRKRMLDELLEKNGYRSVNKIAAHRVGCAAFFTEEDLRLISTAGSVKRSCLAVLQRSDRC